MEDSFISRFVKGTMSTGIGTFIAMVFSFLNIIIVVRLVPKEQFGAYILLQIIVAFLAMMGDFGLNISVTKFIAGSEGAAKKNIVNTVVYFKLVSLILLSLVIFLFRNALIQVFKSHSLSEITIYIPILFLFESFNILFNSILQGLQYYRKMAVAQVILSCINLLFIFIFLVNLKFGLRGLIYARLFSLILSLLYQYKAAHINIGYSYNKNLLKEMFKFGFPLGLNGILTFIFLRIDTLIVGAFLNPVSVAYYGTAKKIPDSASQMFCSFLSVYFPNMSELFVKKKLIEAENVLNNSLRLVSFVTIFATFVIILFQEDIVKLLFSAQYLESASVLSLLMFCLCIESISTILGTSLVSAGYSSLPVIINVVDAVVNIIANLILIPKFGIMGAAYAALLARIAANPANVFFLKRNGIQVNVWGYVKPILIFTICSSIYFIFGGKGIIAKVFLIILFFMLCLISSVVSKKDMLNILKGMKFKTQPIC
jgi:O-antigen/teichoic acid export membrane protein